MINIFLSSTFYFFFFLGNYATIVSHNPEGGKTKVKLPSGAKKTLASTNRAMVGKCHTVSVRDDTRTVIYRSSAPSSLVGLVQLSDNRRCGFESHVGSLFVL